MGRLAPPPDDLEGGVIADAPECKRRPGGDRAAADVCDTGEGPQHSIAKTAGKTHRRPDRGALPRRYLLPPDARPWPRPGAGAQVAGGYAIGPRP